MFRFLPRYVLLIVLAGLVVLSLGCETTAPTFSISVEERNGKPHLKAELRSAEQCRL